MKRYHSIFLMILACAAMQPAGAQVLDSLDAAKSSAVSAEALFAGKVSGVRANSVNGSPVSAVTTNIRGLNSLSGNSQPLWVVDGVIINPTDTEVDNPFWQYGADTYTAPQNALLALSPYDIESVEILKDVSATALYGSRGADGVIIINTKSSAPDTPLGLEVDSNVAVDCYAGGVSPVVSHNHYVSIGRSGVNMYNVSAFYRDLSSMSSDGSTAGARFNFKADANDLLCVGMNAALGLSKFSGLNPMMPFDSDIDDDSQDYRMTDSFYMIFKAARNFNVKAEVGVDYRVKRRYLWYGNGTVLGDSMNGAASVASLSQFRYNGAVTASFNDSFGAHHVSASLFADASGDFNNYNVMNGFDFFDYGLRAKGINIAASPAQIYRTNWNYLIAGAGINASYDYDGMAGVSAAMRADTTPEFDEWTFRLFPSVSVFADLHKILMEDNESISALKLTAGWGKAGNEAYVPYVRLGEYAPNYPVVSDNSLQAFYNGLSRRVSSEWNAGFEAGFLNDRITLAVKYYEKNTDDTLSVFCNGEEFSTNGYWRYADRQKIFSQTGSISNKGLEADVAGVILESGKLKWSASANVSYNLNRVESIPYLDNGEDPVNGAWVYSNAAGYPVNAIVGYRTENGTPVDLTGEGNITLADMAVLGYSTPKLMAGISTALSYGRISFDAMMCGSFGSKYIDAATFTQAGAGTLLTEDFLKDGSGINHAMATIAYDVPLGNLSDKMNLRVNLTGTDTLPVIGFTSFPKTRTLVAGVCLKF